MWKNMINNIQFYVKKEKKKLTKKKKSVQSGMKW